MKRHPAVRILVIAGVFLVGFLLFKDSKPVSQTATPLAEIETRKATTMADSQSHTSAMVAPIPRPNLTLPRVETPGR